MMRARTLEAYQRLVRVPADADAGFPLVLSGPHLV
jgi:hypothetical protein